MADVVYPPIFRRPRSPYRDFSVFLAGSIEMGAAEEWQAGIERDLSNTRVTLYNPRRPTWDSSWLQSIDSPEFNVQVTWELEMIERADLVAFYFDPNTKSPVTMMELGLVAAMKPEAAIVCCPEGFWRKGNVDMMCDRYGMASWRTLYELREALRRECERVSG